MILGKNGISDLPDLFKKIHWKEDRLDRRGRQLSLKGLYKIQIVFCALLLRLLYLYAIYQQNHLLSYKVSYNGIFSARNNTRSPTMDKMSIKSHTKIQSIVKCVFKDDDPRIPLIEKSGFGWVRNIKPFHLDTDLISFLYSKHTKTCFELAEGKKFMISLEDVAHLTGLCIAGKQIVWKEDKNSDALCEKHLGKVPNKEDKVRCDVSLSWLVTIFNDFNSIDMPSEIEVERSARAFILLALGAIIFPNGASSVSPILLTFLVDFDVIKEYQWGAAMLVQTNLAFENKSLIENMWLVQFWAYECFPELRPKHVEESWFDTLRDAPLMTYFLFLHCPEVCFVCYLNENAEDL